MACRNILLSLIPFFLQKLYGNLTVILAYCSFLCKIKNFYGTGAAFLASVRVHFYFHEGHCNPVPWMLRFLTFPTSPDLFASALIISKRLNLNSLPSSVSLGWGLDRDRCFNWLVLKIHKDQISSTTQKSQWAPSILGTQNWFLVCAGCSQTSFPLSRGLSWLSWGPLLF